MMTDEFKAKLQSLVDLDDDFSANVFFAMKQAGSIVLKKANIQREILKEIAEGYKDTLKTELTLFENDGQRSVMLLSDRDDRSNVVYRYDLPDDEPSYFSVMKEPVSEPAIDYTADKMFNFEHDTYADIDYFVMHLGTTENHIMIYRDNFNVNLMKQGRGRFYLSKSGTQIAKVENDILRMDSQIDCMLIDDKYYILNLKNLDTSKEFAAIIKKRADAAVDEIEKLDFIGDVASLRGRLGELSFARRLMTAMDNSKVTALPSAQVLNFVANHAKLNKSLKAPEGKFDLTTKTAQNALVKLLNDDFLHSELTNEDYETSSKNLMRGV